MTPFYEIIVLLYLTALLVGCYNVHKNPNWMKFDVFTSGIKKVCGGLKAYLKVELLIQMFQLINLYYHICC